MAFLPGDTEEGFVGFPGKAEGLFEPGPVPDPGYAGSLNPLKDVLPPGAADDDPLKGSRIPQGRLDGFLVGLAHESHEGRRNRPVL